jgi:hypothetical protein
VVKPKHQKIVPKKQQTAHPEPAPPILSTQQQPTPPVNSIVNNAGKIESLEISDSDVTMPRTGGATILNTHPGSETSKVKIDSSHVLNAPTDTHLLPSEPESALIGIYGASKIVVTDNVSCGFESSVGAGKENGTLSVSGSTVNDPKHCAWIAFVNVLRDHEKDIAPFVDKWKEAQEAAWKDLPDAQKDSYRQEFDELRTRLVSAAPDYWRYFHATNDLYTKPPSFDLNRP